MKRLFIAAFMLSTYITHAQSSLLNADFWKKSPDVSAVKTEITKGNSPSEANRGNHDVVSIAINNNAPLETIIYLLGQEGNSVSKNTHDGRIYLHWAASKGNAPLVKYLIEKGSDIHRTDDKGATPISFAAGNGQTNTEVYDALFKAGNDPKQKFQNGANLLLLSIAYDKELKLATYLTGKGLSFKDTDDLGNTAFDYAARTGDVALLKTLLQKGVKKTEKALLFAAQGTRSSVNNKETFSYLVDELKMNPNAIGDNGENVLHHLVKKKEQTAIVSYFLEKGTDVNQANKEGNTVLMEAAKAGNTAAMELILPKVKNLEQTNSKGMTALAEAVGYGSDEAVSYLIAKKANVHTTDKAGNNLAYYLIQSYKPARGEEKDVFTAKMNALQQAGFQLNTPQKDHSTLYHLAVAKNDANLLKKIDGLSVDINAKNSEGFTALHKAALIAKDDVLLKYLISKGAAKDIATEFDETAYDLASENETLTENNVSLDFLK